MTTRRLRAWALSAPIFLSAAACAPTTRTPSAVPEPSSAAPIAEVPSIEPFTPEQRERVAAVETIVDREARAKGLEPTLVKAVIWVESRFDSDARSPAGARGLMQLMPATAAALAKELGVARPRAHDPAFNVAAGTHYLAHLLVKFDGDERLALAAYHAGPGNVRKWLASGEPFPAFSDAYVESVMAAKARFGSVHEAVPESERPMLALKPNPMAEPAEEEAAFIAPVEPEPAEVPDEPVFMPVADQGERSLPEDWDGDAANTGEESASEVPTAEVGPGLLPDL